jgi:hypothetical protein
MNNEHKASIKIIMNTHPTDDYPELLKKAVASMMESLIKNEETWKDLLKCKSFTLFTGLDFDIEEKL